MKPQYNHLTFDNQKAFNKWLKTTTHCTIELDDLGQDLLKIWVAESGEVLHSNLQAFIWNGQFINMEDLEEFRPLSFWVSLTTGWSRYMVPVKKITYLKSERTSKRQPSHA